MTIEINSLNEAKAQPLSSLTASTTKLYEVRVQAEFLELEFDIDTLLGQLQSLSRLSQARSAN